MINFSILSINYNKNPLILSIYSPFIAILLIFGLSNSNADYANCMKATKHNYITKEGIDHISAQCKAFVKEKVMVK